MFRFLIRRLLLALPSLFGLILLTFMLVRLVPADPAAAIAGENATVEQIEEIRRAQGLDQPIHIQFIRYLGALYQGDFGISAYTQRPVLDDLLLRLPATLELTFLALFLSISIGVPIGVLAARKHNQGFDQISRIISVAGLAMAPFWLAIMLQILFSMNFDWFPLRGRISDGLAMPPELTGALLIDSILAWQPKVFINALWHLILPAATLAFGSMATIARFTRSGTLETLQKDFVTYEAAVGYPEHRLLWVYVLRNSLVATITQIGLLFGVLIAGGVVVEAIFDWPGIGSYAVDAILNSDQQAVMVVTLLIGVIYTCVNILVDLAQAFVDPRIREQL